MIEITDNEPHRSESRNSVRPQANESLSPDPAISWGNLSDTGVGRSTGFDFSYSGSTSKVWMIVERSIFVLYLLKWDDGCLMFREGPWRRGY
jgi:hypothetical protein